MAGLSDVLGGMLGGSQAGGGMDISKLIQPVLDLIQKSGGLQGLLSQLQNSPIGGQVNSWISGGENQPVSGDQVAAAVGESNVEELAAQSGLSTDQVKGGLSELLPNLVDKFTPGGQVPGVEQVQDVIKNIPGADQLQEQVGGLLSQILGGGKAQ